MKPREVFGLVVRLGGLYVLFYAGWYLVYGMSILVGVETESSDEMLSYFFDGAIFAIVALYFLRGAPHLMRFCYPKMSDEAQKDDA